MKRSCFRCIQNSIDSIIFFFKGKWNKISQYFVNYLFGNRMTYSKADPENYRGRRGWKMSIRKVVSLSKNKIKWYFHSHFTLFETIKMPAHFFVNLYKIFHKFLYQPFFLCFPNIFKNKLNISNFLGKFSLKFF